MIATIEKTNERFEIVGLVDLNESKNGKPVFELKYLYTFGGKTYKTFESALKALTKRGFDYKPASEIVTVCGWD